eukprot:523494_1
MKNTKNITNNQNITIVIITYIWYINSIIIFISKTFTFKSFTFNESHSNQNKFIISKTNLILVINMYNWYINNIIKWYKLMRWSIKNIWSNMMIINGTFLGATWSANIKSLIGSDGYLNELPPESLSTSSCPWSAVRIHLNHQHVTFKSISNIIIRIIIWYNSINWSISSNTWCQWYISRIIIFNSHPNRIQKRYQYNNYLTNNSIQIKRPLTIPKASDNYNTCKSKRDAADIERIKSVAAGLEPVYRDEPAEISQKRQLLNDKIIKNKPSSIDKSLYFPSATLYSNINIINYKNSKSMIRTTGMKSVNISS